MAKKDKKIAKSVYISAQSDKYIREHMKAQNITNYSAALDDAIEYAFNPEFRGEREAELSRKVDQFSYSLNEHRKRTGRDFTITQEMLMRVLYDVYARMPPVPEDLKKVRHTEALAQLDKTMEDIASKLPQTRGMKESL